MERYDPLLLLCGQFEDGGAEWFKAFGAWIAMRLRALEGGQGSGKKTADSSLQPTPKVQGGAYRNFLITAAMTNFDIDRLLVKVTTALGGRGRRD